MQWLDRIARAALRSSLLWGALVSLGFYLGLQKTQEWFNPLVLRCLTARWEAYVCVTMFLVGLAWSVIKAVDLGQQWFFFHRLDMGPLPTAEPNAASLKTVLRQLDEQPRLAQNTPLLQRLRDGLEFALRGGDKSLEEHLRYQADIDTAHANTSYGLPRFLCWSIPAVGSFATVLGIAAAVGELSLTTAPPAPNVAVQVQADPFGGVTAGLAMAFDTMALALALSTVLMLLKFVCEQQENQLLLAIDERVHYEVTERAGNLNTSTSSQPDQLRKLSERMIEVTERLAEIQSKAPQSASTGGGTGGANPEQLEQLVARAVTQAVSGQPTVTIGGGGQLNDMNQVQEALKQIATFFSRQQAVQNEESEIMKQLSEMIRDTSTDLPSRKKVESGASSLAGLWNALSD